MNLNPEPKNQSHIKRERQRERESQTLKPSIPMEECMRECMKKLALWFTNTFKPIMTHEELEPMMATLGFVGLPPTPPLLPSNGSPVAWKEYVYSAGGSRLSVETTPPKPRLPFPRIDGLHIYTYRAFIDAVNFYLDMSEISDLFHIRFGFPILLWIIILKNQKKIAAFPIQSSICYYYVFFFSYYCVC